MGNEPALRPGPHTPLASTALPQVEGFWGSAAQVSHLHLGWTHVFSGLLHTQVFMGRVKMGWGGVEEENGESSMVDRNLLHSLHSHKSPLRSCLCEVPAC